MNSGVASLLRFAARGDADEVKFLLDGDLGQMSTQKSYLKSKGLPVGQSGVYPGFRTEEDFKKALRLIWENRVEGWWGYKTSYVMYGICTSEEFYKALG